MKDLFRPTKAKIILFAMFAIIAVGGIIQSYGFAPESREWPVVKALRPVPFWLTSMLLMMPLALAVARLGVDVFEVPKWLVIAASLIYLYVLACLLVSVTRLVGAWADRYERESE